MSDEWDEYADGWDNNEDVISYSEKAFNSLLEAIDIQGLRVLDFGCGTGLLSEKLSPYAREIVALDTSEKMISILAKKCLPNVYTISGELTAGLISEQKIFSEKFDLIIASSVCSFLPDFESTLTLLKSLLEPGGIFIQWDWLATGNDRDFGLSEEEILSTYNNVGFKLLSLDKAFSLESSEGEMSVIMGMAKKN